MTIIDSQFYIIDSLSIRYFIGMESLIGGCLVVREGYNRYDKMLVNNVKDK